MKNAFDRWQWVGVLLAALLVIGCGEPASNEGGQGESSEAGSTTEIANDAGATESANVVALSPENAMIQFIGRHTDKSKDDRQGGFAKFTGQLMKNAEGQPTGLTLEIDTASLYTPIENLTNHLKSNDFFDVRNHPEATFKSSEIQLNEDGTVTVQGDLTMLGETESISFPATMTDNAGTVELNAEFDIDRTEFGMNYGEDNIEKVVTIKFMIGKKTEVE